MDLVFVLENGAIAGLITDKYTGGIEETEQSDLQVISDIAEFVHGAGK